MIMTEFNLNEFLNALAENPFPYPESTRDQWKIIAKTSAFTLYLERLTFLLDFSRKNSIMTKVIGRARAGKTHFLRNFEWRITQLQEYQNYRAIPIFISLTDEKLALDKLIDWILKSETFVQEAKKLGFDESSVQLLDRYNKLKFINNLIDKLQVQFSGVGLILLVDNFDEYLRQMRDSNVINIKTEIERLLGVFRLLITEIPKGLLILLSLTEDAHKEFLDNLSDPTLINRIIPVQDEYGKDVTFSKLTKEEAIEIVRVYMEYWSRNKKIQLPKYKDCCYGDKNVFPFTPEAIELFHRAGEVAGLICFGCKFALQEKIKKYEKLPSFQISDLIIKPEDASSVIAKTSNMWPAFESVKSEVLALVSFLKERDILPKWVKEVGEMKYGRPDSPFFDRALRDNFYKYLSEILKERGAVVDKDFKIIYNKNYELHYCISLSGDEKVGIIITNKKEIDENVGFPLAHALKNGQITHGIFIYYGNEKIDTITREPLPVLSREIIQQLIDYQRNYSPVVIGKSIDLDTAWAILYLEEIKDEEERKRHLWSIEKRIEFLEMLDNLLKTRPKVIGDKDYKPQKARDILDRAGA